MEVRKLNNSLDSVSDQIYRNTRKVSRESKGIRDRKLERLEELIKEIKNLC